MLTCKYFLHNLQFNFEAGTSRGVLTNRNTYYILLKNKDLIGIGEASPLSGLSIDYRTDFEEILTDVLDSISKINQIPTSLEEITQLLISLELSNFPSIRFGLETAFLDLINGGKKIIFNTNFTTKNTLITINGLIWMGNKKFMLEQLETKLNAGFSCLKMKVGAIDFEQEIDVLKTIRQRFSPAQIELRLDANGAFTKENALEKLNEFSQFQIHSIEQPIQPNQKEIMKDLCQKSPIKIALDEELIGIISKSDKENLLLQIKPSYIILKPTLLGGLMHCSEWIELAEKHSIGWWLTSALESNIGLNAICQFASTYHLKMPQGLGTGALYKNNIQSPLTVENGTLFYNSKKDWDSAFFNRF